MRIPPPEKAIRDDGVLPLINIVFLLLVFFLMAGAISPAPDIDIEPVRTGENPTTEPPRDAVYISAEGTAYVGGTKIREPDLSAAISSFVRDSGSKSLRLMVDRRADSLAVMKAIDAASRAGTGKVMLLTLQGGG